MDKRAIHELFYLLKHPGDDDLSMLHLLSSISKPPPTQLQPKSEQLPPLLRLPAELIHIILTHLTDTDAISLALSNTHIFNRASLRLHKLLEHRIPGGWAGKKIAVVGEKAYAPDIITFIDPHSKRTLPTIDPSKSYIIRNLSKHVYIVCDSFGRFREYLRHTRPTKPSLKGTDVIGFTVEEAAVCAFAMKIMWGGEGKEGEWAGDGFDVVEHDHEQGVGFNFKGAAAAAAGVGVGCGGDNCKWVDVTEEVLEEAMEYIRRS
ncbi:hypothetical protein AA313_de0200973 [Arthrobotrys entomopaga]|nr:hypothetical protein AA313_de0200973 [Arthrobotrys entomopaga]